MQNLKGEESLNGKYYVRGVALKYLTNPSAISPASLASDMFMLTYSKVDWITTFLPEILEDALNLSVVVFIGQFFIMTKMDVFLVLAQTIFLNIWCVFLER